MKESIISKIQKLVAKAESAKEVGNIEEAAAFSAKVNELLTRHNLAISDIDTEDVDEVTGVKLDDLGLTVKEGKWTISLLSVIAEHNYCSTIYHQSRRFNGRRAKTSKEASVTIIGRPDNVEVTKYLYSVLRRQFESMCRSEWNAYIRATKKQISEQFNIAVKDVQLKRYSGITKRPVYIKSFMLGAVHGVNKKLTEQAHKAKEEFGAKMTDLMIVNNADIDKYMAEHFPDTTAMRRNRSRVDGTAYQKGRQAGQSAQMARGMTGGTSIPTKMLN
jgi:hypothetical protein